MGAIGRKRKRKPKSFINKQDAINFENENKAKNKETKGKRKQNNKQRREEGLLRSGNNRM